MDNPNSQRNHDAPSTLNGKKPRKSRAAIACRACRSRKVRCSVSTDGPPCSNCRLDKLECHVPARKRERECVKRPRHRTSRAAVSTSRAYRETPDLDLPPPRSRSTEHTQAWKLYEANALPRLIKPIPEDLAPITVEFLTKANVFWLPVEDVRQKFVAAYLQGVHPFYPLLAREQLLQASKDSPDRAMGGISLLVLYTMMFAAVPFVSYDTVKRLGYHSHAAARVTLYQRARALYDADIEVDASSLIQSLVLMSFWYEDEYMQKDAWHWIGSMASLIEVSEPWNAINSHTSTPHMSKVAWWSCFMRDAHVSLAMRRESRLRRFYDKVALPGIEDFEPIEEDFPSKVGTTELAVACRLNAKLAAHIGDILRLDIESTDQEANKFNSCELGLKSWAKEWHSTFETVHSKAVRTSSPIITISLMIYDAAINALYLPHALALRPVSIVCHCIAKLRAAAMRTVILSDEALESDWADYIPTQSFTAIMSAVSILIWDLKSRASGSRIRSQRGLKSCLKILQAMEKKFTLARHLTHGLLDKALEMGFDPNEAQHLEDAPRVMKGEQKEGIARFGPELGLFEPSLHDNTGVVNTIGDEVPILPSLPVDNSIFFDHQFPDVAVSQDSSNIETSGAYDIWSEYSGAASSNVALSDLNMQSYIEGLGVFDDLDTMLGTGQYE